MSVTTKTAPDGAAVRQTEPNQPQTFAGPAAPALTRPRPLLAGFGRLPWQGVVSAAVLAFFALAAVVPQLLATHSPWAIDLNAALQAPSLEHWFGTDQSGRDLYSRVIYGSREALLIGLGATGIAIGLGFVLGVAAGLGNRWVDAVVSRGLEVLFAFPVLLLAMLFLTIYGPSAQTLILAVGLSSAPGYARMVRGQVLAVRHSGYVQAAQLLGHPPLTVLRQHIVPNAVRPLVAVITLGIGQSIVWASGLAFLGLGIAPPSPEWGALLDAGRPYILHAWWLEVMPGIAILAVALAATGLGNFIQNSFEGKNR